MACGVIHPTPCKRAQCQQRGQIGHRTQKRSSARAETAPLSCIRHPCKHRGNDQCGCRPRDQNGSTPNIGLRRGGGPVGCYHMQEAHPEQQGGEESAVCDQKADNTTPDQRPAAVRLVRQVNPGASASPSDLRTLPVAAARHTLYYMKTAAVTIRLDSQLEELLDEVCRQTGQSRSEVVRDALRRQLTLRLFEEARRKVIPFAEAQGIYTDEDVFKLMS